MLFAKILSLSSSSPNAAARDNGSLSRLLYGRHAVVMACSASNRDRLRDIEFHSNGRQLCADRRHVFDHLSPDKFVRNVLRISIMQMTTVVTNYYNDQLKNDIEREDRIATDKITRQQAELEDEEWQANEWSVRIKAIPERIAVALAKYHAVVLVMRLYEHVASLYVTEDVLDKLTMDTFEAAKRANDTSDSIGPYMLRTCWKANMISFMADYSVHQVILAYGYYIYIQEQRRRLKVSPSDYLDQSLHHGSIAISFLRKSTLLAVSRIVGLGFSSIGGALGSTVWPGWGTLVGSNVGDSFALQLTEDGSAGQPSSTAST